jgi:glucosamine-6-phosphate deaminase
MKSKAKALFPSGLSKQSSQKREIFLEIDSRVAYTRSMTSQEQSRQLRLGNAQVHILPSKRLLGQAAGARAAKLITDAVRDKGRTRIMVATGNSQIDLLSELVQLNEIPWNNVEIFHMDEYVGISGDHPSSFRHWIRTRLAEKVNASQVHYIEGDAPDLEAEIRRYSGLLSEGPIDLAFVGFGENGHIAFNDPHVADFNDPAVLKRVTLDEACREQQAREGHFKDADAVPKEAVTVTCPVLFSAAAWVSCVPEARKAQAVKCALEGPLSSSCPASLVRTHPNADVFLDPDSASLLSFPLQESECLA